MESEVKIIIAFVFKRSGKAELKASDIYLTLSLELGWFSSQEAKNFVAYCLQQNYLQNKKNSLTATFDISSIPVPIGFRPTQQKYDPSFTDAKKEDVLSKDNALLSTLIKYICSQTNRSEEEVHIAIQQLQDEKQIYPEVAALLFARKYHIPIDGFFNTIETALIQKS